MWFIVLPLLSLGFCGLLTLQAEESSLFHTPQVDGGALQLVPESERTLRRIVIGTQEPTLPQFQVAEDWAKDFPKKVQWLEEVRRELYDIEFELLHGNLLSVGPRHSIFYVATVADGKPGKGVEPFKQRLRAFARRRAGWSAADCERRLRFFPVPEVLNFSQDMAEPLGYDSKGRLVFGQGDDVDSGYTQALKALCRAYPQDFSTRNMGSINTEGGDLELVWLPQGTVGLLLGHHRVKRWLGKRVYEGETRRLVPPADIGKARLGFSRAFFRLDVLLIGEEALAVPDLSVDELFHADMVVNIVRNKKAVMAFIPTYEQTPMDATTAQPLPVGMRERLQGFYDRTADRMATRGYEVVRLPFADHPVRSPVNVGKFIDPVTKRQVVLLGRYPYHLKLPDGKETPQSMTQRVLDDIAGPLEKLREEPSEEAFEELKRTFSRVWQVFDEVVQAPNPIFERQAALYREHGVEVIPLTLYPRGEGGVHCLLLN